MLTDISNLGVVRVQQALNLAINKQAIIDAVFQGASMIAKNPFPPTIWSYNGAIKNDPYDPDRAKQLLAETGYPGGFEIDSWACWFSVLIILNVQRMAEIIQAGWAKIEVKAKIVSYGWGKYLKRSKDGDHQTLLLGWTGDNGDPDNFSTVLLSCKAIGGANRACWAISFSKI